MGRGDVGRAHLPAPPGQQWEGCVLEPCVLEGEGVCRGRISSPLSAPPQQGNTVRGSALPLELLRPEAGQLCLDLLSSVSRNALGTDRKLSSSGSQPFRCPSPFHRRGGP